MVTNAKGIRRIIIANNRDEKSVNKFENLYPQVQFNKGSKV